MGGQRGIVTLRGGISTSDVAACESADASDGDGEMDEEDLSADGEIAQRLRAKFAAQEPLPNSLF